jgi:hypothetical protein
MENQLHQSQVWLLIHGLAYLHLGMNVAWLLLILYKKLVFLTLERQTFMAQWIHTRGHHVHEISPMVFCLE